MTNTTDNPKEAQANSIEGEPSLPAKAQSVTSMEQAFSHWQLPDVTISLPDGSSNLFGRRAAQVESIEDSQSVAPPTLAEVEDIRQHAEAEGLALGTEQGYQVGIETGRLEGLKQGHDEGLSQGKDQGYEEGLLKAQDDISRFEAILSQFEQPLALLDIEIEQALLTLILQVSSAVIGHELHTHPEHIVTALRLGIDAMPIKDQKLTIRLHPDDHQLVQSLYRVEQLEKNNWQLEADPSLQRGDCIIDSRRSSVDMYLDSKIKAVFEPLEANIEHLKQRHPQRQRQAQDDSKADDVTAPQVEAEKGPDEPAPQSSTE